MAPGATTDPIAASSAPDVLDSAEAGPRAIRGAGMRVGSYFAGALLGLVSAPLLTRHLGTVGFGQYYTVVALVALVGGITEGGLSSVGVREYAVLAGAQRDRFMRNLLGMRLSFTCLGVAGGIAFALLAGYSNDLVVGTALAGCGLLLIVAQTTLAVPLSAGLRFGRQALNDLLVQVLTVCLIVAGVLAGAGVLSFLAVPIPTGLALLVLTVVLVRGNMPMRPAFELSQWRLALRDTYPIAAATAVQTLYVRSVILVLSLVSVPLQTGTYAYSVRIMEILTGIPILLVSATFPVLARAARDDHARLGYVLQRIFEIAVLVGLWMTLCTVIGAHLALTVIAGARGVGAVDVLRVQAIALLLAFLSAGAGSALMALRRSRALLVSSGAAVVVTMGLAFALVPSLGALGGGIASVGGEAALLVTLGAPLVRGGRLRLRLGVLAPALLAAGLGGAAALVPDLPDLLRLLVFTGVYAAVLALTGAVPVEVRHATLDRVRHAWANRGQR